MQQGTGVTTVADDTQSCQLPASSSAPNVQAVGSILNCIILEITQKDASHFLFPVDGQPLTPLHQEAQKFIDKARGGVLSVAQFASEIKPLLDKARQQYGPRATSTCQSIEESINFYCPTDATTKTKPCPRRNYIPYRQRVQNLAFSKFDPYLHHSNLNEETMKYIRSLYKGELPVNPKPSPNKPVDTETGLPSLNERLNENARRIYQLQLFQHLRAGNPNPTSEPEQALLATTMNATTELILQCDNPKLVQNFHQQTTTPNGFCDESLRPTQNRGHWTHQQDANSKPCQE